MTKIFLIIIGAVIIVTLLSRRGRRTVVGICATVLDQITHKNQRKEKALAFIRTQGEASNEDIREHLGVSRRSVVRYLDELEREGAVEQIGDIGRSVTYRLK